MGLRGIFGGVYGGFFGSVCGNFLGWVWDSFGGVWSFLREFWGRSGVPWVGLDPTFPWKNRIPIRPFPVENLEMHRGGFGRARNSSPTSQKKSGIEAGREKFFGAREIRFPFPSSDSGGGSSSRLPNRDPEIPQIPSRSPGILWEQPHEHGICLDKREWQPGKGLEVRPALGKSGIRGLGGFVRG